MFLKIYGVISSYKDFYRHRWTSWNWTIVGKSLSGGYHSGFKSCVVLLLIMTFPADLFNFLMFSRHLSSYKALLLNDVSTPIIKICCFGRSGCNNPLIITHCWSNYSMSIIVSTDLANTSNLVHCEAWALLPSFWKKKYYFSGGGFFKLEYASFS